MLTTRGFWFFLTVFSALAAATIIGAMSLMLICLTLLFWFLAQWFLFLARIRLAVPRLRVQRELRIARGAVESIWARQSAEVVVSVRNEGNVDLGYALVTDRLPELAQVKDGSLRRDGAIVKRQALTVQYRIECRGPGQLRFEGIKLQLADLQGFFTYASFLRDPRDYRVLPALPADGRQPALLKQQNLLPLLGKHRLARRGASSELLDLRDYIPGDPPKMIAWKVSARRDRLITKEFESEVPIRCTLFLDLSSSVRVGPAGATALARLTAIAAGLAQANTAERDLTGLCLFDETRVCARIAPGRGAKHFMKMLDLLTHAAGLLPKAPHAVRDELLPVAYGLIQDVYPAWLEREVNYFPIWLPLWSPQPYSTIPQPPLPSGPWWLRPWIWLRRRARHSIFSLHNRRGWRFSPSYHRQYHWRKQVAAVLAQRYELGAGGLALLLEDDQLCGEYIQRFLAEHQVSYPYPLYDDEGRYLFAAAGKATVLAKALLKAVTQGKDNELFVLCVDLLESSEAMAPLERAVCVARARHHQVVVICPWPDAVELPSRQAVAAGRNEAPSNLDLERWLALTRTIPTRAWPPREHLADLHRLLLWTSTHRLQEGFRKMRSAFGRMGVPVICAAQDDTIAWILHRMRRLRIQERGVR